jgi:hypothetical protein
MSAYGIPEEDIARVVGIDPKTLRKHYRDELDLGATKANAQVAGYLFSAAKNGNVTAQIFWLKTRACWKEAPVEHQHSARIDVSQLTDEELERMIAETNEKIERLSPNPRTMKPVLQLLAKPTDEAAR